MTTTNRAKLYQLVLFPLNNGATNVYFVLILSYIATFGENVLGLLGFASIMVTVMRLFDAITDPIIGALMDKLRKHDPSHIHDDKAKWDVVPTKISMDEILSIDMTPQNLSADKEKGGKR